MRISSPKPSPQRILVAIVGLVVLCFIGWIYYAYHYQKWPFLPQAPQTAPVNTVNYQSPDKAQIAAGQQAKNDADTKQTEASAERAGTTTVTPTPTTVSMIISSANQTGSTLTVRTVIQAIDSSGTCTLELTRAGSNTVTQTSGTQSMGSYSTCKGFGIDTTPLTKGAWSIKVSYVGSANQTSVAQKEVTLQ